jgi:hypothetical protein
MHKMLLLARIGPWRPFWLACSLSLITLVGGILMRRESGVESLVPFLCFVPMCFYFNAEEVASLRKQIDELQRRLDERDRASGQVSAS